MQPARQLVLSQTCRQCVIVCATRRPFGQGFVTQPRHRDSQSAAVETLSPLATPFPPKHLYFPYAPTLVRTDYHAENLTADFSQGIVTPNQLRWKHFPSLYYSLPTQALPLPIPRSLPYAPTLVRADPLNFPAENLTADFSQGIVTPNQLRWKPFPFPSEKVDWVRSLFTICGSGR